MTRSEHWSDYWANGFLTSLPQDFRSNYDGEIAAFWKERFAGIPSQGVMLDVCTGNGAVALLAAQHREAEQKAFRIMAMDAAMVDTEALAKAHPSETGLLDGIEFFSGTPLESLDLPGGRLDLVTSQYGIEYCDWRSAARQVSHWLKPGGHFAMLCHQSSSEILTYMREEREEYRLVEQLGWMNAISDFLGHKVDSKAFRTIMEQVLNRLAAEFQATGSPFFRTHLKMLNATLALDDQGLEAQREKLATFRESMRNGWLRLQDLLRVNAAIHDNPDWFRVFERHGIILKSQGQLLYQGVHEAGRYYIFSKPGS